MWGGTEDTVPAPNAAEIASAVWALQAASAQAAGSIGELTGEIWRRLGLDPGAPMATSQEQITAGAGITITLADDGQTVTATRQ